MFLFEHSSLVRLQTWHCLFDCDRKVNFQSLTVLQIEWSAFGEGMMENVLCGSPALELFELSDCRGFKQLVIASKSLKRLYLGNMYDLSRIEIECPKLEELVLHSIDARTFRFNLPSLICGTLSLPPLLDKFYKDSAKRIIKQFPNVWSLRLVGEFVKIALQVGGLSVPLKCKNLTLDCYDLDMQLQEIKYALCNSPQLEKLVMDLQLFQHYMNFSVLD